MIPVEKEHAVGRALQGAFGVNAYQDIHPLPGGLSTALTFQIFVKRKPYLLKILRKEVISDPAHEFACMQTAAKAGIAPRIWYANAEDRILITDFVEAKPFPNAVLPLLIPVMRTLHSLPHFPMPKMGNYFEAMDKFFVRRFQAAKLLPGNATDEIFLHYDNIVKVYPRNESDLVASHNDLKPQNMRFDGQRIWLVDWESAFLNDEYVDLAIVANFFVKDAAQEEDYLRAYFGQPAGDIASLWEYRRSRFYLMRQALSMFYATLLLLEASGKGLSIDANMNTPDFRAYHQDLISNKIDMLTAEAKLGYGMLHLREALRNMRTPRFDEALAIVSDFHASR